MKKWPGATSDERVAAMMEDRRRQVVVKLPRAQRRALVRALEVALIAADIEYDVRQLYEKVRTTQQQTDEPARVEWLSKFCYMVDWRIHMSTKLMRAAMDGEHIRSLEAYQALVNMFHKFTLALWDRKRRYTPELGNEALQFFDAFVDRCARHMDSLWHRIVGWNNGALYGPLIALGCPVEPMMEIGRTMHDATANVVRALQWRRESLWQRYGTQWENMCRWAQHGIDHELRDERCRRGFLVDEMEAGEVVEELPDIDYGDLVNGDVAPLCWPLISYKG